MMGSGFNRKTREEVRELTSSEMKYVQILVDMLFKHQGIGNRIYRREIEAKLIVKGVGPERVTDLIAHIRKNNLVPCLVTYRGGYYVATTRSDMADYICRLDYTIDDLTKQLETLCRLKEDAIKQCKEKFGKT